MSEREEERERTRGRERKRESKRKGEGEGEGEGEREGEGEKEGEGEREEEGDIEKLSVPTARGEGEQGQSERGVRGRLDPALQHQVICIQQTSCIQRMMLVHSAQTMR